MSAPVVDPFASSSAAQTLPPPPPPLPPSVVHPPSSVLPPPSLPPNLQTKTPNVEEEDSGQDDFEQERPSQVANAPVAVRRNRNREDQRRGEQRNYCPDCGEIILYEPSIYFHDRFIVVCHACAAKLPRGSVGSSVPCKSSDERNAIVSVAYQALHKKRPASTKRRT